MPALRPSVESPALGIPSKPTVDAHAACMGDTLSVTLYFPGNTFVTENHSQQERRRRADGDPAAP